jgi:hypothetical protein
MRTREIIVPVIVSVTVLAAACGAAQKLHIESDPSGAEVYLMRRGDYEVSASVNGFGGSFDGDSFEDDFYLLGSTPLDYEFDLSDSEGSFFIPGVPAGASVTKHYQEGILRIVMDGYETEERTIQFSDNLLNLVLTLTPDASADERGGEETGRSER